MKKYIHISLIALCSLAFAGCSDYLDIVPKGKKVPSTLADYRAFLENPMIYTMGSSDAKYYIVNEFLFNPAYLNSYPSININYQWLNDGDRISITETDDTYDANYQGIYYANLIINSVPSIKTHSQAEADEASELVAQAKVLRAIHYFYLINTYAKPYHAATAATDGGVPYITTSDNFDDVASQVSVEQVYQNMLKDLKEAMPYLPNASRSFFQPNKAAGYAMLARVQLFMKDFTNAFTNANEALKLHSHIFDMVAYHNTYVDPNGTGKNFQNDKTSAAFSGLPRITLNAGLEENIIYMNGSAIHSMQGLMATTLPLQDSTGAENYVRDSARFEEGDTRFICNYWKNKSSGTWMYMRRDDVNLGGIRSTEVYLMRAECYARRGDLQQAMDDLNAVRVKRIIASEYKPLSAATVAEAISYIRRERDSEMMGTGMNFYDMRRFNTEPAYRLTLKKRDHLNIIRTLEPDSELWTIPFAKSVALYNSSIKQNTKI